MKPRFLLLAWLLLTPLAWAQPIRVAEVVGADRTVSDPNYGVAFVCPPGWELRGGSRWGDLQATLFFHVAKVPEAQPAVYYSVFYEPLAPAEGIEAWLRGQAENKAKSRARENGYMDYVNRADSLVVRTIGDGTALSWVADYTNEGRKWCELMTEITTKSGHAFYFVKAPADKVADLLPEYETLVNSTRLSEATALATMNPLALEGRRLHRQKAYAKALEAFQAAFKTEPVTPIDLVAGAGTAARAGERELALTWLRLAIAKGFNETGRIAASPDFAALHDTEGWKTIVASLPAPPVREAVTDAPLQARLLAILKEDQKYRKQLGETEKTFGRESQEITALRATIKEKDAANLAQVKEILDQQGWVGPDVVGREANMALFLVIQHADHATQMKYLPLMREAVKNRKAQGSSLALLEDRVALGEGQKQIYGSQIGRDTTTGKFFVSPLEDPDHVDERRARVGLPPLAEYVKHWDIAWDVEAHKQQQAQREQPKE